MFFWEMDKSCNHVAAMGDAVSDDAYEDIILRAITPENNFIREKR